MPLPALLYQTQRATSLLAFPQWVSPKNCHQDLQKMEYQWSETFHFWKALWDFTFSGFAKRGSLDTQGEIRGGLLDNV